jgi:hypothetical protein
LIAILILTFYNIQPTQAMWSLKIVKVSIYTPLCDKYCQWLAACRWFSLGTLVSSTNKTECHYTTEIFLKMASNTTSPHQLVWPCKWIMKIIIYNGSYIRRGLILKKLTNNELTWICIAQLHWPVTIFFLNSCQDNLVYFRCTCICCTTDL